MLVTPLPPTTPPVTLSVPLPPPVPPRVRKFVGLKVPLDTLMVPTPFPWPTSKLLLVTEPPATLSVPVPLWPSWMMPACPPITRFTPATVEVAVIREPLLALIVMFSGMNRVLGAVPESWSVPPVPLSESVPVPETVLLIVSVPEVCLKSRVPLLVMLPATVAPSFSCTVSPGAMVPPA